MARIQTRILRYLFRKIGYDLKRLQRTRVHDSLPESRVPAGRDAGFDGFDVVVGREVDSLDIVLRTCSRVMIFGDNRERMLDVTKTELIHRCLHSLVRSVAQARQAGLDIPVRLSIVDDHSDEACLAGMRRLLERAPCETDLLALEETGNGKSIGFTYDHVRKNARDLIYIVEDDYLHDETAVFEMVKTFERLCALFETDVVLFPTDYSDRYRHIYPTYVVPGSHRHWRAIDSTTGTMMLSRRTFLSHWDDINRFREYGIDPEVTEANSLDLVYRTVPCFSPLPTLAVHLGEVHNLSLYANWRSWWQRSAVD